MRLLAEVLTKIPRPADGDRGAPDVSRKSV